MKQYQGDTGLNVKSYIVVKTAVLDFNQALKYITSKLTDLMANDLSTFVNEWWPNLTKLYRDLRLSLEAEGRPDVSLFYLQVRVLDAIWSFYFGLRDGPSPYTRMMADAMKYQINGKGDCIVAWAVMIEKLQDDPAKAESLLASPRGSIEYNIEVPHKDGADGVSEREARPKRTANQAVQKGKMTRTCRKRRHRNADVEDDSSDFNAKDSDGEVAMNSEEDQAGSGSGSKKTLVVTKKGTKLPQTTPDLDSQRTTTPGSWLDFMKPQSGSFNSGTGSNKTPKVDT